MNTTFITDWALWATRELNNNNNEEEIDEEKREEQIEDLNDAIKRIINLE